MQRASTPWSFVALALLAGAFSSVGAWHVGWWAAGFLFAPTCEVDLAARTAHTLGARVVHPPANAECRSYRELFASLPGLESAVAKLRWNHGSEAEAAHLMALLQALKLANTGRREEPARGQIERVVVAAWQDHPQLVTASVCADCGDTARFIDQQLETRAPDEEWVARLAAGHPKRFHLLAAAGKVPPERVRLLAHAFGELGGAGRAQDARFIANALIEDGRNATLRAWVSKGLNGSFALGDVKDLATLPPGVVTTAWEHGAAMSYEDPRLTAHLLKQGYRPALRWVLWLLDDGAPYLDRQRLTPIKEAARRHIAFASADGAEMARFYSDHWREIGWDAERETWQIH